MSGPGRHFGLLIDLCHETPGPTIENPLDQRAQTKKFWVKRNPALAVLKINGIFKSGAFKAKVVVKKSTKHSLTDNGA